MILKLLRVIFMCINSIFDIKNFVKIWRSHSVWLLRPPKKHEKGKSDFETSSCDFHVFHFNFNLYDQPRKRKQKFSTYKYLSKLAYFWPKIGQPGCIFNSEWPKYRYCLPLIWMPQFFLKGKIGQDPLPPLAKIEINRFFLKMIICISQDPIFDFLNKK